MKRTIAMFILCAGVLSFVLWRTTHLFHVHAQNTPDWSQWGRTSRHNGATPAIGQSPHQKLADITFDPFTAQEQAEFGGELLTHYQAPLIDGETVFLEFKTGTYVSCQPPGSGHPFPCGPDAWNSEIWNERAFTWQGGSLVQTWNFESDWKPEPNADGLGGWEPVFHAALGHGFVYVPGASGSVYKVKEADGTLVTQYKPFGNDANTYVSGPLTLDASGNIYYNAMAMNANSPWDADVRGAWLVRVSPQGAVRKVSFTVLVPGAPTNCGGVPCGSQRAGLNVAPALSPDGKTIYTASRAHFAGDYSYLVAVNPNLTPKWQTSLRNLGGSGVTGYIDNLPSSTPSVAPDGSILYGVLGGSRGYLLKFNPSGQYLTNYGFGWDTTPAIFPHDGTYSVILKDNFYGSGPYYMTQLDANLGIEWQYQSPTNFEWCVNAPAVDGTGTVYANSEDGDVYVINPGGSLKGKIFLRRAIGAAYTPISIGRDGKIYTENDGDMFVIGN